MAENVTARLLPKPPRVSGTVQKEQSEREKVRVICKQEEKMLGFSLPTRASSPDVNSWRLV